MKSVQAVAMCNLYNLTSSHQATIDLARALRETAGNLPSANFYPDLIGVDVRTNGGQRELARMRWGLPSSSQALFDNIKKRADKLAAKGQALRLQRTPQDGAGWRHHERPQHVEQALEAVAWSW